MTDPVQDLTHDHADLNRRVLVLGARIRAMRADASSDPLVGQLGELREQLFLHFAREEEGLFPFVVEAVSDLGEQVTEMELAHDTICGDLARMFQLASTAEPVARIASLFDRFEHAYANHARAEADLLKTLDARLNAGRRARLAVLVDGL